FTVERELRQAGYGINNLTFLGCKIQGRDALSGNTFALDLLPVKITQGAAGAPDTITVMYGNGDLLPNPASIIQNMPSATADFKVSNRYGFQEGDIVIVAEAGKNCTLAQASNLPGALGQTDNIIHGSGTFTDPTTGLQKDIRYNPSAFPPGSGITYTTNAKMFNLGAAPANNIYSVPLGSAQLTQQQALFAAIPAASTPLFDGIVQLQAQYGKDTDNNGVVDLFDEITPDPADPAYAAQWAQVLAVRLAVVVRSNLQEKPDPDGVCRSTTVAPSWAGGAFSLAADPNWQCYRYKVFQTVVPIRNMIWRP
ncbi:MAG: PilW family protein, partial [Burkholderiales bacterium]